jgi:hypothetical protein
MGIAGLEEFLCGKDGFTAEDAKPGDESSKKPLSRRFAQMNAD